MRMDNPNGEHGEASTSTHGTRRQQAREFRRRLLRSSRTAAAAQEDHGGHGAPPVADVEGEGGQFNEPPRLGISPDARWALQTPEGQFSQSWTMANHTHTYLPSSPTGQLS